MLKPQRVFRLHYLCEECTKTGSEWTDYALTQGHGYCPCCDRQVEPYATEQLFEEFEDDEEEVA